MIIQITKLRALINQAGGQSTPEALSMINKALERQIIAVVDRAKADGTIRLSSANLPLYMPIAGNGNERTCQRCAAIDPVFLKFARTTQEFTAGQAKILLGRLKGGQ